MSQRFASSFGAEYWQSDTLSLPQHVVAAASQIACLLAASQSVRDEDQGS